MTRVNRGNGCRWSAAERTQALDLARQSKRHAEIGQIMGRSEASIEAMIRKLRSEGYQGIERRTPNPYNQVGPRPTIPDHIIAEQKAKLELQPVSTTAALMGDPLPGYSALDRR